MIKLSPRVFAWCRVRWSCAALAVTIAVLTQVEVSRETVRLELKAAGYVWKHAKLKGRDDDPERARRLARIRPLIENQRPDELILFAEDSRDKLPSVQMAPLRYRGYSPFIRAGPFVSPLFFNIIRFTEASAFLQLRGTRRRRKPRSVALRYIPHDSQ